MTLCTRYLDTTLSTTTLFRRYVQCNLIMLIAFIYFLTYIILARKYTYSVLLQYV